MYSRHFTKMYDHCENCGQHFNLEPDFYVGAMYVSYGIEVLVIALIGGIFYTIWDPEWWVYVLTLLGTFLIFIPVLYRISRSIWIHIFVRYRKPQGDR